MPLLVPSAIGFMNKGNGSLTFSTSEMVSTTAKIGCTKTVVANDALFAVALCSVTARRERIGEGIGDPVCVE